jgi:polysaccharide deacetylase family protein (PEP-CTERM system associated)
MVNALTVDVEEWFHICGVPELASPARWDTLPSRVVSNTDRLLDLLASADVHATFFVLGWVAERHPALVARIRAAGHEVGCHSHLHRRVYELGAEAFAEDLQRARAALAAAGAPDVSCYRAPEWSINDRAPWALDELAAQGIRVDSSRAPMRVVGNPDYPQQPHTLETSAGPVIEVPPAVCRWFGQQVPFGGGWGLRMSRPSRVVAEIDRRNAAGIPVTLWVHPWELDPDPPRVRLPVGLRIAHYFRLEGLAARLNEVLRGATFGTMGSMLASLTRLPPAASAPVFSRRS